jgi:hypothetical protein
MTVQRSEPKMKNKSPNTRDRANHDRGVALIPIVAMLFVLLAVGSSALVTSTTHTKRVLLNRRASQAFEIAQTGLARALYELERSQDLDSVAGIGNVGGDFGGGRYDATTVPIGNNYFRTRAVGWFGGVRKEIETIAVGPETIYGERAIAAKGELNITGVFSIDSYDSGAGTYASQATNSDAHGTYANENAMVASNADMDAGPNAVIRGDALLGPSATLTVHTNTYFTGQKLNLPEPLALPDPPIEDFQAAYDNNSNGSWSASGGTPVYDANTKSLLVDGTTQLTLSPGTYFFSELTVAGGASLVVTDKTKIYVVGNFSFSGGGIVNLTDRPQNLEIVAHPYAVPQSYTPPSPPTGVLTGGAHAAAAVYAPAYDLTMSGSGDFMGAVIGKNLDVSGVDFHFDESLEMAEGLTSKPGRIRKFQRVAWREISLPVY